jgi:hydroxypyruvate isomerase
MRMAVSPMAQLKLSACIEMIFNQLDILDRPAAVAEVGLPGLEFWGWKNKDVEAIKAKADAAGVQIAAFCIVADAPLVNPETTATWVAGAQESILLAERVGVPTLITTTGQEMDLGRQAQHDSIVAGLKAIAPFAEAHGITIVLEPLNVLVDHKGYFLVTSDEGFEILDEVGSPNVKLLFDIYHQQISEGNLIARITSNIDKIGHFHVADVPGRFEPGTGEINYQNVFARIAETDYAGFVGLEFRPSTDPATALRQVRAIAGV